MKKSKASSDQKLPPPPTKMEMVALLSRARDGKHFTQVKIEEALGIDQGQISKIFRGEFVFPRGNALRLFTYVQKQLSTTAPSPVDVESLRAELTRKLMAAWDETPGGAQALGVILDGASRLREHRG